MGARSIEYLCELIAVPSVNPRLAGTADPGGGEQLLTDYLAGFCRRRGWQYALQEVHPGRANLLARIPGGRGDALLWDVHQDTVSGQGMSTEPFTARRSGGRLYGRGACDVKGAMAAMLAALERAASTPAGERPTILLACTVNEECGFTGARALASLWQTSDAPAAEPAPMAVDERGGLTRSVLRQTRPAAALIAEPTELNVVVAHRGVVRWQCIVEGRAAHSSRPEDGVNALYAMADVVQLIKSYHERQLARRPADALCGPPTACVTTIAGGTGPNTVPDRAVIDVDRRLTPQEWPEDAYRDLVAYVAEHTPPGAARVRHDRPWMESRGLAPDENGPWASQIAAVARSVGAQPQIIGVPYGTNAASIAAAGIPAIVFGPGSIAQAHTADEWIAVEQLELAEEAYYQIACGAVRL
ncbi:MAG: acetylornithine deacetylase [Planctomycetota bacterium]|nr:MAG: acetylornithine deacetylase [Planctomycetota bacterium]